MAKEKDELPKESVSVRSVSFLRQVRLNDKRKRALGSVVVPAEGRSPGNAVDMIVLMPRLGLVQILCDGGHTEVPLSAVLQLELEP